MSVMRLSVVISAVDRFSNTFNKLRDKGESVKDSLKGGLGMQGVLVGVSLLTDAFSSLVGVLQSCVQEFIEFDKNMARVQAVTQTTAEEIQPMTDFVKKLGQTTQFTATQVAEAAETLTVAGISLEDQMDGALESTLQLALAGGVGIQEAAKIAIGAIKGMGLEFDQLGRVNGVLVATFQQTATTISDLGAAMSYLAPVGRAAGMKIEDLSAAIGILGDAGYRGTVAGTGLRQAIAKMLAPSTDARKVMSRLGLSFGILSPAAQEAETSLNQVASNISALQKEVEATNMELQELSATMGNLTIEQTKNSIAISKIRLRASKQQRQLTEAEEYRISRLQNANAALGIQQQEYGIIQKQAQMKATGLNSQLTDQQEQFNGLNQIVENGTQSLLPFTEVIERLQSSGATTAEIMEIFGVRGGQAIFGLMANADKLKTLTESLFDPNISKRAEDFAQVVGDAASGQMRILESAINDLMIAIGEELMVGLIEVIDVLIHEFIPAFKEDVLPIIKEIAPVLVDLLPLLMLLAHVFLFIAKVLAGFATGDWWVIIFTLLGFLAGLISGIYLMIYTGGMTGMGTAFALAFLGAGIGGAAGLGISSAFSGDDQSSMEAEAPKLATGGIVRSPTVALVGEAGAEAVIPLNNGAVPVQMTGGDTSNVNAPQGHMFQDSNVEVNIVTGLGPFGYLVSSIMDDTQEWSERTGHRNRSNLRTVQ